MAENEKSYYKKLIKMISHEAKAFLNEGADEHVGFYSLILKKKQKRERKGKPQRHKDAEE